MNVLGDKLLQGLRKAAEKHQDQVDAVALDEQGKAVSKARQALQMLRKMVHLMARLQVKSGAEMAFPIIFGHMPFSTHRTWEMNVRRPVALLWKSWEASHGKSVQRLRHSPSFRHTLNMFLPQERDVALPSDWLVMEVPSDSLDQKPTSVCLLAAPALSATSLPCASPRPQILLCRSILVKRAWTPMPAQWPCRILTLPTAIYFDDWLHRGTDNLLASLPWYV